MLSQGSGSSKRTPVPRTTTSNPEHAIDYVAELLYTSKDLDTTSDLKRPRAASGSALLAEELESDSILRPSTSSTKHVYGQPCPDQNQECHYHNQLTQYCHIPWRHCSSALNAIKQSYKVGGEWTGAPIGWNEAHEPCLKTNRKCDVHAKLQRAVLEKQKNKKYPEKLRVRGKDSRGTKTQPKGKNET
ncbi:hypothetical protein E4T50_05500 [Aureobasidium sp. EXF-12298]|nr:hypothetical protein E4T50_05500 [Aureobasidium sp. EXF-12298]